MELCGYLMILSNDISEDKKLRKQTSYFFFQSSIP